MTTHRMWPVAIALVVVAAGWPVNRGVKASQSPPPAAAPILINTCLITSNVKQLVDFYEPILQMKAKLSGDDYAEFATGAGVLAIFSAASQEKYIPGSAEAGKNKSMVMEFKVADVDLEYARLKGLVRTFVKPPTTQAWGDRSFYFRDPDGNLVDFYAPVKAQ